MKQDTLLQLKNWLGNNLELVSSLGHWGKLKKKILEETALTPTAQEVFDILYPEKVLNCPDIRFVGLAVGYRTCKKNCACYTQRVSESIKQLKQEYSEEKKDIIKKKRTATVLEKYGVENVFMLDATIEKSSATKIQKYQDENFNNREKSRLTTLEKYGVDNVMQLANVQTKNQENRNYITSTIKNKETKQANHNDSNYNNSSQRAATNLSKYGYENAAKSQLVREKISTSVREVFIPRHMDKYNISPNFQNDVFSPGSKNSWRCNTCNIDMFGIVRNGQFSRCMTCNPTGSLEEIQVRDYITSLGLTVESNNRTIIGPLELDIWIPEKNVAIEYCGLYWHREGMGKDRHYHSNKTKLCREKGIKLVTLFSDQWIGNRSIVESRLQQLLGQQANTVGARSCTVSEINNSMSSEFLLRNHLQGHCSAKYKWGLFSKNQKLLAVMTFGASRFKKGENELLRFAVESSWSVPGAAGKLLAAHMASTQCTDLISYSDNAWGYTDFYGKIGFRHESDGSPGYSYVDLTNRKFGRLNRMQFQKHKLSNLFGSVDTASTEYEIMKANGYDRIWDCGQSKWRLENH